MQATLGQPFRIAPLGVRVMAGLSQESKALVQCEHELPGRNVVTDYVHGKDRYVHAAVDLSQQNDRKLVFVRRPKLGVVTCGRSRAVVIVEEPALDFGIVVRTVGGRDDGKRGGEVTWVPDASRLIDQATRCIADRECTELISCHDTLLGDYPREGVEDLHPNGQLAWHLHEQSLPRP